MTEGEVQQLFVHHSFAEAKRMLIEECERNGHELLGHENVFELKALATQGAKSSNATTTTPDYVAGGEGTSGGDPSNQNTVEGAGGAANQNGESGEGGANGEPNSNGENGGSQNGEGGNNPSNQSSEGGESGEGGESQQGQNNQQNGEPQNGKGQPDQNGEGEGEGENEGENGKPKKKRRNRKSQNPENGENGEGEPKNEDGGGENGEGKEKTPEELDAEANQKMKEAQELAKQAEEIRKKQEEERKKQEEEAQKNNKHRNTDEVVRRLKCLHKAFLVGPAGTGKSTLAMCACRELFNIKGTLEDVVKSNKFAQISFSPDTVTADMLGFTDVNGVFHETDIIRVFREGGLILFDEMDDADASLLVKLNTMLANRVIPTPNGVVTQHPDCYIVGTANTYGTGGNSMYVGRSRLDAATLDRWKMATIFVEYDTKLEAGICLRNLDAQQAKDLQVVTKTIRDAIEANKWKQICSTRFVIDSCNMMKNGYKINQCIDTYLLSWEENNRRVVKSQIRDNLKNQATLI